MASTQAAQDLGATMAPTSSMSPSRQRRMRAAETRHRLWLRTRWASLAEEEEEQEEVEDEAEEVRDKGINTKGIPSDVDEGISGRAQIDEIVTTKFQDLESELMGSLACILKTTLEQLGVLKNEDLNRLSATMGDKVMNVSKKIDVLSGRMAKMEDRAKTLEAAVDEAFQDSEEGGFCDKDQEKLWIEDFRRRLCAGMPIHVEGLKSRPELNGCAGLLGDWVEHKERWKVQVGSETVLIRTDNIVP